MEIHGSLWLNSGENPLASANRIALLQQIDATGSITHAAKAVGMSYKTAWDTVNSMNNLAGTPLVERSAGGKGGGGTRLTEHGRQLIASYRWMEQEQQRFLGQLGDQLKQWQEGGRLLRRLSMQTSARNQFFGTVTQIKSGAVNDIVELEISGGDRLRAQITHESTEHMGLQIGSEIVALIKAPWVLLGRDDPAYKLSADNRLAGVVLKLLPGAVNTEVVLQLKGGNTLTAMITVESAEQLALSEGQNVQAFFNASHIILGVLS